MHIIEQQMKVSMDMAKFITDDPAEQHRIAVVDFITRRYMPKKIEVCDEGEV